MSSATTIQPDVIESPWVLVVEDDPLAQARLESLIETAGLGAVSVSSAQKARAALRAVFFPIVIIDRMLEDGDGIQLCCDVRQQRTQGRIVLMVVSALDSSADIAEALAAGAEEYLSKRATDDELLARFTDARRRVTAAV